MKMAGWFTGANTMTMHNKLSRLVATLLLGICAVAIAAPPDDEERGRLSTKMVNLSSAVDAYFSDLPEAPTEDDQAILKNATQHDSRLLSPEFEPYLLKVQYQAPYAVLLLCSKDGQVAIMEDAGCSARLDRQVIDEEAPCEFTLRVSQGCQVDGEN